MKAYFKIPADTDLYNNVKKYHDECYECNMAAANWAKQFNQHGTIIPYGSEAGSIWGVGFKENQKVPKGWIKKQGSDRDGFSFYRPNGRTKAGKQLLAEMQALPKKSFFFLTDVFGYQKHPKLMHPGFYYAAKKQLLIVTIELEDLRYWAAKPDSAEEITASEYAKLIDEEIEE